ncbi:DNA starvation/stationary phase protection protein [Microbacterium saccharophilum]|uniref:DNA starvation/stationary phase protection protein n=1 Tax=Microbacterium saccharophilum TaxID=1213358 RepID=A0A5C8I6W7_9MICO|nr:DNA starvation/stationary phase protection protein [Microbacterium saccharophilum]TXK13960.1 DNA starvation/stationary phase protection protein [Microbacterium saccharophilum]GEP46495.1 DNA starvation/stationary phase protection protein [Microbacterium saccharophilum]
MNETHTIPMSATDPEVAAGTAQFLTPVVLGLQGLAVNGKQAHWNVRGSNFIAIHELLDTVVANAQGFADEAAERIVALGLPIDARVSTVAAKTKPTAVPAGFTQWQQIIAAVVGDMDAVIADVQAAIDGLDEIDLTSQDIVIGIKAGLEKDRWFLSAHLAG